MGSQEMFDLSSASSELKFGEGEDNPGEDFSIFSSEKDLGNKIDVLIFTDSRGFFMQGESSSWATQLASFLRERGLSVLLITRPKVLTVFFSLINFIEENDLSFRYLITNMGVVDCAPLKRAFVEDIQEQYGVRGKSLAMENLEPYELSSGEVEMLCSMDVLPTSEMIAKILHKSFDLSLLMGTTLVDSRIEFSRKRPESFYQKHVVTNRYVKEISKCHKNLRYVEPLREHVVGGPMFTHDALHFTDLGHDRVAEAMVSLVEKGFLD